MFDILPEGKWWAKELITLEQRCRGTMAAEYWWNHLTEGERRVLGPDFETAYLKHDGLLGMARKLLVPHYPKLSQRFSYTLLVVNTAAMCGLTNQEQLLIRAIKTHFRYRDSRDLSSTAVRREPRRPSAQPV